MYEEMTKGAKTNTNKKTGETSFDPSTFNIEKSILADFEKLMVSKKDSQEFRDL